MTTCTHCGERRCHTRELDELTSIIRNGAQDHFLLDHIAKEEKEPTAFHKNDLKRLLDKVYEDLKTRAGSTQDRDPVESQIPTDKRYPDDRVVKYLSHLGLHEQLHAYFARFAKPCPEELAHATECTQVQVYDCTTAIASKRRERGPSQKELNLFRLAQKLRNEHGTKRMYLPSKCFSSFEDIIELESGIRTLNETPFIMQCIGLKTVDDRHAEEISSKARSHSELFALHNKLEFCSESTRRICLRSYVLNFTRHAFKYANYPETHTGPTWPELELYLRAGGHFNQSLDPSIYDAICDNELDEALNWLLNFCARTPNCFGGQPVCSNRGSGEVRRESIRTLIDRGADLMYKHPDQELYSLEAIVKTAVDSPPKFPKWLFRYLCCPLRIEDGQVVRDPKRLSSLTCLAARMIPPSLSDSAYPFTCRGFVRAHQGVEILL